MTDPKPDNGPCEFCPDTAVFVADVWIPDNRSVFGEGSMYPTLICPGADCRARLQAHVDNDVEGTRIHDVCLAQPAYLTPDDVAA